MGTANFRFLSMLLGIATPWVLGISLQLAGVISSFTRVLGLEFIFLLIALAISDRFAKKYGAENKFISFFKIGNPLLQNALMGGFPILYGILTGIALPAYVAGRLQLGFAVAQPWVLFGFCVLVYAFSLIFTDDLKFIRKKSRVIAFTLSTAFIVGGIVGYWTLGFPRPMFCAGLKANVEKIADVQSIRKWLAGVPCDHDQSSPLIPMEEWPRCIRELAPTSVCVNQNGVLLISWGGGFLHWGLGIFPNEKTSIAPRNAMTIKGGYVWLEE